MKAFVYGGAGKFRIQERPKPEIENPGDAIIRVLKTTICHADLNVLKGDVGTRAPGRILGREGIGIVDSIGPGVRVFKPGDRVLVSSVSPCGKCEDCRRGNLSSCRAGASILGDEIDGTQAEYVRTPNADSSLYPVPAGVDEDALVLLNDILPNGFDCAAVNAKVAPGSTVAIIGAGPVGLAALLVAQLNSPAAIIVIDPDEELLALAGRFGATSTIDGGAGDVAAAVRALTDGRGVEIAIETIGLPPTLRLSKDILAPGGIVVKIAPQRRAGGDPSDLRWSRKPATANRPGVAAALLAAEDGAAAASCLMTYRCKLDHISDAYYTFGRAADTRPLRIIITV